ncbi:MAG: amidase, partial [Gluconacetobacter diazotrophicus]|nr:amidase [Gluconacetobacter diazotrophicus]
MRFSEYAAQDATGLARLAKAGDVSPSEIAETARAAAARLEPDLNAFVEIWRDEAI